MVKEGLEVWCRDLWFQEKTGEKSEAWDISLEKGDSTGAFNCEQNLKKVGEV